VLPSARIAHVNEVVLEVLADPSNPRFVTALAPVLVTRIEEVQLDVIASRLYPLGLSHRLSWVVDNTVTALDELAATRINGPLAQWRRARLVLGTWLARTNPKSAPATKREDVLDVMIRSDASVKDAKRDGSGISRRWGVVSWLTVDDFVVALREAA